MKMTKCPRPFHRRRRHRRCRVSAGVDLCASAIDPRQLRNELCFSRHDFNLNFSTEKHPGEIRSEPGEFLPPSSPPPPFLCLSLLFFCFYRKRCEMSTAHREPADLITKAPRSLKMKFFTRRALPEFSRALPAWRSLDLSTLCLCLSTGRFYDDGRRRRREDRRARPSDGRRLSGRGFFFLRVSALHRKRRFLSDDFSLPLSNI